MATKKEFELLQHCLRGHFETRSPDISYTINGELTQEQPYSKLKFISNRNLLLNQQLFIRGRKAESLKPEKEIPYHGAIIIISGRHMPIAIKSSMSIESNSFQCDERDLGNIRICALRSRFW